MVGDDATPLELASDLRRAGYSESRNNPLGHYHLRAEAIEIFPGPDSYFDQKSRRHQVLGPAHLANHFPARQHRAHASTSWNRS